jgi:hypothetical protein
VTDEELTELDRLRTTLEHAETELLVEQYRDPHARALRLEMERLRAIEQRARDIEALTGDVGDAPATAHFILTGEES